MTRHSPTLIEIFRADTSSVESAIAHLISALRPIDITWNYIEGIKRIRAAYKGLHDIDTLTTGLPSKVGTDGYKYNRQITEAAAPIAFSRKTQVIDLSPRGFPYRGERFASYRIPFFFVEDRTVKAYGLQTRKRGKLAVDQIAGYASVIKNILLDTEFFGEKTDIEFVDLGCMPGADERSVEVHSLGTLTLWPEERLNDHFGVIADALSFIEENNLVEKRRRPLKDPDMPLFGDL